VIIKIFILDFIDVPDHMVIPEGGFYTIRCTPTIETSVSITRVETTLISALGEAAINVTESGFYVCQGFNGQASRTTQLRVAPGKI
jgi:hypothetical protein